VPKVLADRYEIDSILGEGGMARVYRGTDNVLGRTVAVKVLASQYARDETSVTRFRREAQSAASLNHPNVVSVYDTGSDDGVHWIVMEYLEGRTLREVIDEDGPLSPEHAAKVARDVSLALATAHEKGLVHRDVKPANIMITPSGETKVMDFGIARAVTSTGDPTLTKTGFVMGTAAYLSPEQAEGKPVDARSDIYSLGCVVYEMLTAQPPFDGDSPVAVAGKHLSEEPEPISQVNPAVPREVEAVIARAMRKDPGERYQDAREMADDLGRAVTGELPVGAAASAATEPVQRPGGDTRVLPAAVPEPLRESFRRTPWLPAALIGTMLAVLAVVAAFLLFRGGTEAPATRQSPRAQTPTESPSPTGPPSVTEAFNAFNAVVNDGFAAEEISAEAAEELLKDAREVLENYQEGDLDAAMGELDELHAQIDEFLDEEQITSSERGEDLHDAADALEGAILASAPQEGEGDGRRNNGGKGKGKGHDGDGGDD
jgi:eukaryotic-like serine/threonine-protein kinase